MPDGTIAYTRDGSFKLDADRRMVTTDGYPLADNITIDQNAPSDSITIAADGTVSCKPAGEEAMVEVGRITLSRFVNPAGLTASGKNLFLQSDASGEPLDSQPGIDGAGTLAQGYLEMSNVQIVEEMVNMIVAQRAYESNSKAITTSDSMLEIANQLKR
jgi:flagellar basal-body rod protein FlgG